MECKDQSFSGAKGDACSVNNIRLGQSRPVISGEVTPIPLKQIEVCQKPFMYILAERSSQRIRCLVL